MVPSRGQLKAMKEALHEAFRSALLFKRRSRGLGRLDFSFREIPLSLLPSLPGATGSAGDQSQNLP